jgi:hypothetical protein
MPEPAIPVVTPATPAVPPQSPPEASGEPQAATPAPGSENATEGQPHAPEPQEPKADNPKIWASIKKEQAKLAKRRAEVEARAQAVERAEKLEALRASDPMAWLEASGVDVKDLAFKLLGEKPPDKTPAEIRAEELIARAEAKEKALLEAQQAQEVEKATQQAQALIESAYLPETHGHIRAYLEEGLLDRPALTSYVFDIVAKEFDKANAVQPIPSNQIPQWMRSNCAEVYSWIDDSLKTTLEKQASYLQRLGYLKSPEPTDTAKKPPTPTLTNAAASTKTQQNSTGVRTHEERMADIHKALEPMFQGRKH